MIIHDLYESPQLCPECGGISFSDLILAEKKDACYYKVKASAKVWPSAYASGRLVQCRKKGAGNYGNKSEGVAEGSEQPVSFREMVNVVDEHYPKYYAELSGSDISDKQFERAIVSAYKAIVKKQGVAGLDEAHHGSLLNPKKGQFASVMFQSEWDTNPQIDYYNNLDDAKFDTENASAHHGSVYAWNGARWVRKMSATERTGGGGGYGSWEENKQGVAEMDKSQTPPGRDGSNDPDAGKKEYTAKATTPEKVAKHGEKILNKELNKKQGVAEGSLNEFAVSNGDYGGGDDSLFNYAKMWYNGDLKTQRQVEKALQKNSLDIGENEDENGGAYISDKTGDYYESWTSEDLEQGVAEEYELAGVGVAYELGRRAYKQGMTIRDNPYSATREARKNDEWAKGLERGQHDANDARHFRSSIREQGVAEDQLDEKSTSQAQFRTMAAAAHNPKFAKKVGISRDVAKEFHGADRKQDYTDLPKKANEGKSAPKEKEADYGDDYQDMVARVKKLAGLGPLKTVYDPNKRVYRNMPTAVQPKK
jgi:hypothetical protein